MLEQNAGVVIISMNQDGNGWALVGGFSVSQHYLAAYLGALASICTTQCMRHKALPGGRIGVQRLSTSPQVCTYLATSGSDSSRTEATGNNDSGSAHTMLQLCMARALVVVVMQ